MTVPFDPYRAFKIVTGVIKEALGASGRSGVVVSGGGPEEALLARWMEQAGIARVVPSDAAVEGAVAILLEVGVFPDRSLQGEASALAGSALARVQGLLHMGTANKSSLLLSDTFPTQPAFPLGDLYASEIRVMAGSCTLPPCLRGASDETVRAVDLALRAYLEEGFDQNEAFGGLEESMRQDLLESLAGARKAWNPRPLIPKLSKATLGLDLDL
jgi:hypothetical protein